jgi:hypothetical protein
MQIAIQIFHHLYPVLGLIIQANNLRLNPSKVLSANLIVAPQESILASILGKT